MDIRELLLEREQKEESYRPRFISFAVVRCAHFQCLACRDADGKWYDFDTNEELPDVKAVLFPVL